MKLLKIFVIFGLIFSLAGCAPSNPTTEPKMDPTVEPTIEPTINPTTVSSVDPTTEPSVDPSIDPTSPSIDDNELFYIKNIECSNSYIGLTYERDKIREEYINYSKDVYNVDNILLTYFDEGFIYKYEVEYSGKYNVDELNISLNEYGFDLVYRKDGWFERLSIDEPTNIPVELHDNKIVFYIENRWENRYNGVTGDGFGECLLPILEMTINKAKYNNEWTEVTENNNFLIYHWGRNEVGLDIIKNSEKEVIIDFSNYKYKDSVSVNKGIQLDTYSYLYEEEGFVDISFDYVIRSKQIKVSITRTLEIKLFKFEFNEEKPFFEINDDNVKIMNATIVATHAVNDSEIKVNGRMSFIHKKEDYYQLSMDDSKFDELLNNTFESFIYCGVGFELDLTSKIKSQFN